MKEIQPHSVPDEGYSGVKWELIKRTVPLSLVIYRGSKSETFSYRMLTPSPILRDDILELGLTAALWPMQLPNKAGTYLVSGTTTFEYCEVNGRKEIYYALHKGSLRELTAPPAVN